MQFDPNKITFFGRTDSRGKNIAFGIKAKDRQRHMYVIGKTGMGKSTLLENMAVQDIQNGEGLAFIDPHGSAAETLLSYIPPERVNDVLYFAPSDTAHPISFNIMEDVGPDKRHLVVSGLMSVFKKIWVDAWSARMEYILSNTLLALLEYPDSTLLSVNRMLADKNYRELVVKNVTDPAVKSFWVDEFAKYTERFAAEATPAIQNKIGQFTSNPIIRNIIGQPKSSFDIRQMMDDKKILIMNLSKGLIGETNANLLGSMLTTRIYLAAMSRADLSPEKMRMAPNFYFYVDEFQSFANATFANILSEARKYHLNLTIAHQYIEQMEEEVRNAVFGNVGTIISFRVGPFDAEVLETIFTPQFLATDIVNLGFAQVYLTLMIDGMGSQPFSATTLPPIAPQSVSYKDMVIAASRSSYARPRTVVEDEIIKFHEPVVMPKVERRMPPPEDPGKIERRPSPAGESHKATTVPSPAPTPAPTAVPATASAPVKENEIVRDERRQPYTDRRGGDRRDRPREDRDTKDRRPQQTDRPRPPVIERPPVKKDSQDHLSDLRSLLKKVVEDESKSSKEESSKEGSALPPVRRDAPSAPAAPIVTEQRPSSSSSIPKDAPKVTSPLLQRDMQEATAPKPLTPPKNGPTPKELERMMRVTTSDKQPF